MPLPRFRIRTLMLVVWLSALVMVGALDVLKEVRNRSRAIGFVDERGFVIFHGYSRYYYIGPIPLGPCPTAVFSGLAFAATIIVWRLAARSENRVVQPSNSRAGEQKPGPLPDRQT